MKDQPSTAQQPTADRDTEREVREWLDAFASAIRRVDFEAGRSLFDDGVFAFGTVGTVLDGLEMLMPQQWKQVWPVTKGFHFHAEPMVWGGSGDTAWVAVTWTSQGRTPDGTTFDRHGRATYVLRRRRGRWLAVHSHHSMNPIATIK